MTKHTALKASRILLVVGLSSAWGGAAQADWWCAASVTNPDDRACWESEKECRSQTTDSHGYQGCAQRSTAAVVNATFRGRGAVYAAFPDLPYCERARAVWSKDPNATRVSSCSLERYVNRPPAPSTASPGASTSLGVPFAESCATVQDAAKDICDILYKAAAAHLVGSERGTADDGTKRAARLCRIARAEADAWCDGPSGSAAVKKDTGSVVVESAVGGSIFLDGQHEGAAPAILSGISPGEHVIEVRSGSEAWRQTVNVVAGQQIKVTASLGRR
jgi:hypothetical protein